MFGFDSFKGLPLPWGKYEEKLFDMGGIPPIHAFEYENTEIYFGFFNETLPLINLNKRIGLLHIDSDLFESAFEIFMKSPILCLLEIGSVVVFDELFNLQGTYGEGNFVPWWRRGEYLAWQLACKHFGIEWAFFKEAVELKEVKLMHVRTDEQAADMLTKSLATPKFAEFRDMVMGGAHLQCLFDAKAVVTHSCVIGY